MNVRYLIIILFYYEFEKVGENIKAKIKTTQHMESIAPDNIKKKSSFEIKIFKNIILKFFLKINKNLYKLLSIKEVAQLFTNGGGGGVKIGEERTTL